jgi:SAM-dependent methyltransferase
MHLQAGQTKCCRFCDAPLTESFVDLGKTPLSNAFIPPGQAQAEKFYELHAYVCGTCRLVQLGQLETPQQIFGNYAYFSSYSETWLRHAERYTAAMTDRLGLGPGTQVVEIASNDGYLLQYFQARGVPVLGIEPAANVAEVARAKGIPTDIAFFGAATAERLRAEGVAPALIAANNVLAHVPDINDFVRGLAMLLAPDGVITLEFPHLLRLIEQIQFDTIYHEHFSYFSLLSAERILAHHGIDIFDVEELSTHGGSLRLYAGHRNAQPILPSVGALRAREREGGLDCATPYAGFAARVAAVRQAIRQFFADAQRDGRRVAGYGAPAKGNTLLNHCGIGAAQMPFTVDRSPHKQGLLLPGSHIPILSPDVVFQARPDFLFILPWNLSEEIMHQMAEIRAWGGRFVVPIPQLVVL